MYTCPVCYFDKLDVVPRDYQICDCCGTEFGNDDEFITFADLRRAWIAGGAKWFFGNPPPGWNPYQQLVSAYPIVVGSGSKTASFRVAAQKYLISNESNVFAFAGW